MCGGASTPWFGSPMKKEKEKSKRKRNFVGIAYVFLGIALVSFGFDLFHFSRHLGHDRTLLGLPGVALKLVWKGTLFLLTFVLLILSVRRFVFLLALALAFGSGGKHTFAASYETCERAREWMKESGIARDAKEDFFGRLQIKPPRSSFPPEMDQVTWWGTFKPFEFWESPEFEATWINPRGEAVEHQVFRGGRCQLAKTTLPVEKLPQGRLEAGMWRVVVACQGVMIDNHPFAVIGSPVSSLDGGGSEGSAVMIWADDVKG